MNNTSEGIVKKVLTELVNEITPDLIAAMNYIALIFFLGLIIDRPLICTALWLFTNSQLSYLEEHCADEINTGIFEGFFTARQQYKIYKILNPVLPLMIGFYLLNRFLF